jgi:hypothetical protein
MVIEDGVEGAIEQIAVVMPGHNRCTAMVNQTKTMLNQGGEKYVNT